MAWRMSTVRDISHHNTIGNYDQFVANAESVQIKITESTDFLDNAAVRHYNGCHGMRRAPYHFARPVSLSGQISHYLRRKDQIGEWERPDMLDCEFTGINGVFIRGLVDEYRKQSGIRVVQVYLGLHLIITSCPPTQWWDEDIYIQVARYRKIGAPSDPDGWRNHIGYDHPGLSSYQWDNATPFYPGGPVGDVSFDRVFVGGEGTMAIDNNDVQKIWGALKGGGAYEGLCYILEDAAAKNPPDGYATRINNALRGIMTGVPTTMTPEDRSAIIEGVTNNLITHFEENPPEFNVTVDNAAIAKEVLDGFAKRQAE